MKTNKYIVSFDLYRNDEWQDLERIVNGETKEKALADFKDNNRLAKRVTIKEDNDGL